MRAFRVLAFLLMASGPALADELTAQKKTDIGQLLQMTGALSLGKQMAVTMVAQMTEAIRTSRPDIPQRLLDGLPKDVEDVIEKNTGSFRELMIPLYHKHFTGAEIKEMIRFYSTDLGRKTIRVMPTLVQESMAAGQLWGRRLAPEIEARIKARFKKEGIQI